MQLAGERLWEGEWHLVDPLVASNARARREPLGLLGRPGSEARCWDHSPPPPDFATVARMPESQRSKVASRQTEAPGAMRL